jgi:hypothetical protein
MTADKPSWPLLSLTAALFFLSVLLNFTYPADKVFTWRLLLPSIDVWLLLILLAMAACCGKRLAIWSSLPIWAIFLVLRLIRIGDTVVPMYLDRPFNLSIDSGYLFGLYDLLKTSSPQKEFLLMLVSTILAIFGFMTSSWYTWRQAAKSLAAERTRLLFLGGSGLVLGAVLVWGGGTARPPALVRLGQEILFIHDRAEQQKNFMTRLEQASLNSRAYPASLKGLDGADVLLFVVESYGRIVFSRSEYKEKMDATLTSFAKTLEEHGFKSVSSSLVSPTYGGSSWLAHGTLESGLRVGNDLESTALLRSSLPPIASYFRRNGYRTVSVMPGTRFAFPEGAYFGYEQAYYAWHFNYHGPAFGWAPMPDQYVLDWVHRQEFTKRRQPLFVRYVLISSHAAFNVQPPYIADWDAIGDGTIYTIRKPITYPITWPELKDAGDAYLHSLDYEFAMLGDYLAKYVKADSLIIILGDHQPNLQLTGPGEPWSVPVHIISRNSRLLEPFRKRGYTPGLTPAQSQQQAGMETFLSQFLQDFR